MSITVEDLFRKLSYGVLRNLNLGLSGDGDINEANQGQIIDYTNEALIKLATRFMIKQKTLVLQMITGHANYYMLSRFSMMGHDPASSDPIYIMDSGNPFTEDWIKVLEIRNNQGRLISLNDKGDRYSIFTPQFNQIQIASPVGGLTLDVTYQAKHAKLEYGIMDAEIFIPDILELPLISYIGYRAFSDMGGELNTVKAQEHLAMYENQCSDMVNENSLGLSEVTTNTNFERNGWV